MRILTLFIFAATLSLGATTAAQAPSALPFRVEVFPAPGDGADAVFAPETPSAADEAQGLPVMTGAPSAPPSATSPVPRSTKPLMDLLREAGAMREEPRPLAQEMDLEGRQIEAMIEQAAGKARVGARAEAKGELGAIIQAYPGAPSTQRAKYELALLEEKADDLIARLSHLIAEHPASFWATEACFRIGEFSRMTQQYEDALAAYGAYLARRPGSAERLNVQIHVAECMQRLERFDEAAAQYEQILGEAESVSQQARVRDALSLCHMALNQNDRAVEHIEAVIRIDPSYPRLPVLLLNQGLCLEELGRYQDAARRYRDVLNRFPRSVEADSARIRLGDLTRPLLTVETSPSASASRGGAAAALPESAAASPASAGRFDPVFTNTYRPE